MGLFGNKPEKTKSIDMTVYHVAGLPIPDGVSCVIQWKGDKITFLLDGNNQYHLSVDKIIDIIIKTEAEIQQAYISSIGRATAGAMLFGPLGAIVGGRAQKKQVKNTINYIVISYKKTPDQETEYLSFEIRSNNALMVAKKIVKAYRATVGDKEPKEIEL